MDGKKKKDDQKFLKNSSMNKFIQKTEHQKNDKTIFMHFMVRQL